jgi:hypothetical protein
MRLPPVSWAFLGLAVIVLIGYLLNQGIYIGAEVAPYYREGKLSHYYKHCRYLYFSGIRSVPSPPNSENREEVEKRFCAPLGNSN